MPSEDLAAELKREQDEVERLRGLLVARDAELGTAKGRLAELEAPSTKMFGLVRKLRKLLLG